MTTIKEENAIILKFGGGQHTRASIDEIHDREAASGQNYALDLENFSFRNRQPFDLVGTVANSAEIRGGGTLIKSDGTIKSFFQAGDTVYEWVNGTSFNSIATVESQAKLRGRIEHNWQLTDKLIITDINLSDVVMEWDGSTFQDVSFTKDDPAVAFGSFKAKYCIIDNERAYYLNVIDSVPTTTPNLIVGSKRSDFTHISISNRPSSAISAEDPFFLVQPDNRAINGAVGAFGLVVTSSDGNGSMFYLGGSDATDFQFIELFARSGASGVESVVYVGNDVFYARKSAIESLRATQNLGDVESDDLTVPISNVISGFKNWTSVYNSEKRLCYFFPENQSEVWVLNKPIYDAGQVSPWSKYTTIHSLQFKPTFVMNMLDPADGLEYVFMGDSAGRIYRMEGTGSGDAGQNVTVERTSKLFSAILDAKAYNIHGWIKYKKNVAATVKLTLEYQGETVYNQDMVFTLPATASNFHYNNGVYYNNNAFYGVPRNKLHRQIFAPAGQSNEFQVTVRSEGTTDIEIIEVGFRFEEAS